MSNTFRAVDAFEFVDAVRSCNFDAGVAEQKARELSDRMGAIEGRGERVPSALLAAYRGYEWVIVSGVCPGGFEVVKLDDTVEEE